MSYSSAVKKDLVTQPLKRCCRRSLLLGILFARGCIIDGEICIRLEDAEVIDATVHLIKEQFTKDAQIRTLKLGGNVREIVFAAKSALAFLGEFDSKIEAEVLNTHCNDCSLGDRYLRAGLYSFSFFMVC